MCYPQQQQQQQQQQVINMSMASMVQQAHALYAAAVGHRQGAYGAASTCGTRSSRRFRTWCKSHLRMLRALCKGTLRMLEAFKRNMKKVQEHFEDAKASTSPQPLHVILSTPTGACVR
eukprot:scaffold72249_cov20-Tisochrysis_lutea.AAC.1